MNEIRFLESKNNFFNAHNWIEFKLIPTWRSSRSSRAPIWNPSFAISTLEIGEGNIVVSTMFGIGEDNVVVAT
jgi:hypothetical protein